ncbi:hypothetical protein Q763_00735 [Flavobacterium beibuense F44-8]|uniref:2-dehydro-3-deoxyphosphooctonate aldolase n=2 Tax=Flavobacterium beibuense TaxID=657326 RepID=A0A0A2LWE0_9FLAO|nr:hypothetical protein Q763_00735 [Flavobacterium beibuense F44-8]
MKTLFLLTAAILVGCSSSKSSGSKMQVADDYGYSEKNPIKVGGVMDGPEMDRDYLNRLTGPNGEAVKYTRRGSCCHFKSKNAMMGMGLLDIYEVEIKGDTVKKVLYLNMYDKVKLFAPKGFLMK